MREYWVPLICALWQHVFLSKTKEMRCLLVLIWSTRDIPLKAMHHSWQEFSTMRDSCPHIVSVITGTCLIGAIFFLKKRCAGLSSLWSMCFTFFWLSPYISSVNTAVFPCWCGQIRERVLFSYLNEVHRCSFTQIWSTCVMISEWFFLMMTELIFHWGYFWVK